VSCNNQIIKNVQLFPTITAVTSQETVFWCAMMDNLLIQQQDSALKYAQQDYSVIIPPEFA